MASAASGGVSTALTENMETTPTPDSPCTRQPLPILGSKKVIARTMPHASSSSLNSLGSQKMNSKPESTDRGVGDSISTPRTPDDIRQGQHSLFLQVSSWAKHEKKKLAARRQKVSDDHAAGNLDLAAFEFLTDDMELSLDQLERVLAQYSSSRENIRPRGLMTPKQRSAAIKGLRRGSLSDSDYTDTDQAVPSADVALDNSKTLLYSGGEADSDVDILATDKPPAKDRENWLKFKSEILRLAHTLGLKGWRRVPLEAGGEVEVIRLSGALTNAVYVVSPPKNIPSSQNSNSSAPSTPRRLPP